MRCTGLPPFKLWLGMASKKVDLLELLHFCFVRPYLWRSPRFREGGSDHRGYLGALTMTLGKQNAQHLYDKRFVKICVYSSFFEAQNDYGHQPIAKS